jgi:hypothetical protein
MYPSTHQLNSPWEWRSYLGSKTGLLVQALYDQNEFSRSNLFQNLLIDDVQGRFVDQSNVQSLLSESVNSVERSVEHISICYDVSLGTLSDEFVLGRLKFVGFIVVSRTVFLQDPRDLGSGWEDESDTLVVEYSVDHTVH